MLTVDAPCSTFRDKTVLLHLMHIDAGLDTSYKDYSSNLNLRWRSSAISIPEHLLRRVAIVKLATWMHVALFSHLTSSIFTAGSEVPFF